VFVLARVRARRHANRLGYRVGGMLLSLMVLGGVAAAGYWAGTNAVAPPALPLQSHEPESYTVANGTVGSTARISVTAAWTTTRTLHARGGGTITSVPLKAGDEAAEGAVIATIDLQPVVVATGSVPMFRTLASGMSGPDVAQLQQLLTNKGFYSGKVDGDFGQSTRIATKSWQNSIGAAQTGVVDAGALLFVDRLPARMAVIPGVADLVAPGGVLVNVLASSPAFTATITATQRSGLSSGQTISIMGLEGGVWTGTLGTFEPALSGVPGSYIATITGTLCGADCGLVPVSGETALEGTIVLVPTTSGPIVPTSAMVVQPSGQSAVTMADGSTRAVTVVAQANGFAVVEGLEPGAVIRLPVAPER